MGRWAEIRRRLRYTGHLLWRSAVTPKWANKPSFFRVTAIRPPLMIVPAEVEPLPTTFELAHGWVVCGIERVASEALAVENLGRRGRNVWHQVWSGYKFCAAYVERV